MVVITTRRCRSVPPAIVSSDFGYGTMYVPGLRSSIRSTHMYNYPYATGYYYGDWSVPRRTRTPFYGLPYAPGYYYGDLWVPSRERVKESPSYGFPYLYDDLPNLRRPYKASRFYELPLSYDDTYLENLKRFYKGSPYLGRPYSYDVMYAPGFPRETKVSSYFGLPYSYDDSYLPKLRKFYKVSPFYGLPYAHDDTYTQNLRSFYKRLPYYGRKYSYDDMYVPSLRMTSRAAPYHGHPYWYDDMFVPSLKRAHQMEPREVYPYSYEHDYMRFPHLRRSYWMPAMYRYPFEVNYDYGFGPASRKAQRISQYLHDDHDSLRSQSRRQDAALMRDITSRMDDTTSLHHAPPVRRSRARSPVAVHMTSHARSQRASSVPPHFGETRFLVDEAEDFLQRPMTRSRYHVEDYEPYHYKPLTSYVSHQVRHRAGSEPPVDRSHPHLYTSRYLPSSDLAVRQARASLGRLERELSTGWEDPYHEASEYLYAPVRPYRQATFGGVTTSTTPIAPIRSFSPVRSYSPVRRHSPVRYLSHTTPSLPTRSRYADIEAHVESMVLPETGSYYAGLRSRAADARSKIDKHKVMLDRYLPLNLGTEKEVGWWHRHLHGGHRCRTLGSEPVKYYVRQNVTPNTSVIKLLYSNPPHGKARASWWSPLGYVAHSMRSRVPTYITSMPRGRVKESTSVPDYIVQRNTALPITYYMR